MQLLTPHGVSALHVQDGQEPELLRYRTASSLDELDELLEELRKDYAHRDDIRIDITA